MRFTKKYNIEDVREIFSSQGCELLGSEYKDCVTPIEYRCSCGTVSKIRLHSFQEGHRCMECCRDKLRKHRTLSYSHVKEYFEKEGYKLISTEYVNNSTTLEYICPNGHAGSCRYGNFRSGRRCRSCAIENGRGVNHPNFNPDRQQVEDNRKFRKKCRELVRRTLKSIGTRKTQRSEELLGYTHQQLKDHLTSHPNLNSITGKWVIDHIFPIKAFVDYGVHEIDVINSLDNIQPLSELQNLVKNDNYDVIAFEDYLRGKGYVID